MADVIKFLDAHGDPFARIVEAAVAWTTFLSCLFGGTFLSWSFKLIAAAGRAIGHRKPPESSSGPCTTRAASPSRWSAMANF